MDAEWTWGRLAKCEADLKEPKNIENEIGVTITLTESTPDIADIEKEQLTVGKL